MAAVRVALGRLTLIFCRFQLELVAAGLAALAVVDVSAVASGSVGIPRRAALSFAVKAMANCPCCSVAEQVSVQAALRVVLSLQLA